MMRHFSNLWDSQDDLQQSDSPSVFQRVDQAASPAHTLYLGQETLYHDGVGAEPVAITADFEDGALGLRFTKARRNESGVSREVISALFDG